MTLPCLNFEIEFPTEILFSQGNTLQHILRMLISITQTSIRNSMKLSKVKIQIVVIIYTEKNFNRNFRYLGGESGTISRF